MHCAHIFKYFSNKILLDFVVRKFQFVFLLVFIMDNIQRMRGGFQEKTN